MRHARDAFIIYYYYRITYTLCTNTDSDIIIIGSVPTVIRNKVNIRLFGIFFNCSISNVFRNIFSGGHTSRNKKIKNKNVYLHTYCCSSGIRSSTILLDIIIIIIIII